MMCIKIDVNGNEDVHKDHVHSRKIERLFQVLAVELVVQAEANSNYYYYFP